MPLSNIILNTATGFCHLNNVKRILMILQFVLLTEFLFAQEKLLSGVVYDSLNNREIAFAKVMLGGTQQYCYTDDAGKFSMKVAVQLPVEIVVFQFGYSEKRLIFSENSGELVIYLLPIQNELDEFEVVVKNNTDFSMTHLNPVVGTAIYAGKKSEVVLLDKVDANLATNNSRQVYAKVAGLNIWESDAAGLQLGIGGRGLSPNRTSNFNTRQNGYDISADAMGYPESYYTPSTEALDRVEIIRGASSLQYGTQFGGVVNFVLKKAPKDKPFEVVSRETIGSFGLFNAFNSVSGTKGKWSAYAFYQHKKGDGWRQNSGFSQDVFYANLNYAAGKKLSLGIDYTYMTYLAQQPGGLTDQMFAADPTVSVRDRNWMQVNWNLFALHADYELNTRNKFNLRTFGLLADRNTVGYLGPINRLDPNQEREIITGDFKNAGAELRFLHHYNVRKNTAVLLTGTRIYKGQTQNRQGTGTSGADPAFNFQNTADLEGSDYLFPSFNLAWFAENIFYIGKKISITPGIRLENINTSSSGYYKQTEKDLAGNIIFEQKVYTSAQRKRFIPLAGVGISYKAGEHNEFYANISQNYRAINFSDLQVVNPNFKVDPNISDEYGYTGDAGWRGVFSNYLSYDLSAFYINYKNRIGEILKSDPSTLQVYRYRTNIGDSYNIGVESYVELNVLRMLNDSAENGLNVFANVAYINAYYLKSDEPAISHKRVEFVPDITAKTGISFRSKNFSCTYQFSYVSEQYTDATNADYSANAVVGVIPAYWVMDFSCSYNWKWFKLQTGVNNLTNQIYFTRRATAYPGPGIIPADPRNFYLTLMIKI